ncbi:MAG: ATP-dependent metallopeptidase FtsH/Yme1/Tma family protein [Calditrichaeota bacterium]|nr:MAG: ATP-dependent metallopeptidase FtsH/Yme1/Tma family protein [Calditrichota bacterium]
MSDKDNKFKNSRPPEDPNRNNNDFQWKKNSRSVLFWVILFFVIASLATLIPYGKKNVREIPYSQYLEYLNQGKIIEGQVIIGGTANEFHGRLKSPETIILPKGKSDTFTEFKTVLPFLNEEMDKTWREKGIEITYTELSTEWLDVVGGLLPWVLLIAFWLFFFRRMQGGGAGRNIFSFGKSRARMLMEDATRVTFDDVAGCDEAKEELREIIEFLKSPAKFSKLGGKIPKGALLLGPPGTGKTLLARAVAGEAGVPFFSMSGADFVEMFVGVGASRVRDLFEQGRKHAPCIIFIDEIDAVGRQRGAGLGGGHDEREQTLNALLVEMDGFDTTEGVIIIAATNRPDVLDAALLRPGRFDRQIVVDRPDVRGREGILKVHTKRIPLADDVDLEVIAKGTPGLAGAELASLVNEAALYAARANRDKVTMEDFEMAKDKIMMGIERKSLIISEEEKRSTAYHEAGHALVAKLIPGADPVHKVTIIPRGRALGITHFLPMDENHTYSKEYLEIQLCALMGGRVAEKLVLNHYTTGAGNDIERATDLARKMVTEWGMSEKLGPVAFGKKDEEIFLGREIATHRDFSERTAQEIDAEIKKIVRTAEEKTEKLLTENIDKLHRLAQALLEREILDGEEIDMIIEGKTLPKSKPRTYNTLKKKTKAAGNGNNEPDAPAKPSGSEEEVSESKRDSQPKNENDSQENKDSSEEEKAAG